MSWDHCIKVRKRCAELSAEKTPILDLERGRVAAVVGQADGDDLCTQPPPTLSTERGNQLVLSTDCYVISTD